jgi:hypothetical protein
MTREGCNYSFSTYSAFVFDESIVQSLATLFQLQKLYSVECYGKVIMDGKYVRIWKEEVLACFKLLPRHSPRQNDSWYE